MRGQGASTRSIVVFVMIVLAICLGVVAVRLSARREPPLVSSPNGVRVEPWESEPVAEGGAGVGDEANEPDGSQRVAIADSGAEESVGDPCEPVVLPARERGARGGSLLPSEAEVRAMIRGLLVDLEGRPVEGYVTMEHVAGDPNGVPASAFAIVEPDYWPPAGLLGCARDVSGTLGRRFLWPQSDPNEELVLVLEPCASVIGHVVGTDRKPIPDVRLDLQTQMLDGSWRGGDMALDAPLIDEEGYFVFDRVPVGLKVKVTAHRGTMSGQSRRMDITPGEMVDAGEITMTGRRPGEGVVQGRITDELGRPMAERSIRIRLGRNAQWLRTDAGGYFVLTELPQGRPITLVLEVDGYGSWSRRVVPDDFNCDFRLCPQGYDVVGREAPPLFVGNWFNHTATTLAALRGRVVLLTFRSFDRDIDPGLAQLCDLQNEYDPQKLQIIAAYNYLPGSSSVAAAVITDHLTNLFAGAPIAGILDADPALVADLMPAERPAGAGAGATHWMYQVHTRPAFYLIDRAGVVRHCTGSDAELGTWIEQLLAE